MLAQSNRVQMKILLRLVIVTTVVGTRIGELVHGVFFCFFALTSTSPLPDFFN